MKKIINASSRLDAENEMIGMSLLDLTHQKDIIHSYQERALQGKEDDVIVDVDSLMVRIDGLPLSMTCSLNASRPGCL